LVDPPYLPYHSIQAFFPSFIRAKIFTAAIHPLPLVRKEFTATSFYGPFLADFGIYASAAIVIALQAAVSYCYLKGKTNRPFFKLAYATLFAALCLSFFYNYFFSLVTIFYLALCVMCQKFCQYRKSTIEPTHQSSSPNARDTKSSFFRGRASRA